MSESGGRPPAGDEQGPGPVDPSPDVDPAGTRAGARPADLAADHADRAVSPSGRRPRVIAPLPEIEPRRRIPWWWVAAGLFALVLVVRGAIGAATGPVRGTPSAAVARTLGPAQTATTPTPTSTMAPLESTTSSPTATISTTPPVAAPTTPTGSGRVVLPRTGPATTRTSPASASPEVGPLHPAPTPVCAVNVDLAPYWGGYNATLTIRNTGNVTVNGWQLSFRIGDQEHLTSGWGASLTGGANGGAVLARDGGYNAVIAPGATATFGLQAQRSTDPTGSWQGPSGFALNGGTCS